MFVSVDWAGSDDPNATTLTCVPSRSAGLALITQVTPWSVVRYTRPVVDPIISRWGLGGWPAGWLGAFCGRPPPGGNRSPDAPPVRLMPPPNAWLEVFVSTRKKSVGVAVVF